MFPHKLNRFQLIKRFVQYAYPYIGNPQKVFIFTKSVKWFFESSGLRSKHLTTFGVNIWGHFIFTIKNKYHTSVIQGGTKKVQKSYHLDPHLKKLKMVF